MNTFGYIEVIGLVTAVQAADAALKAANIEIVGKENTGAGMIAVIVKGEIGQVRTAIDAAEEAANMIGKVVNVNVISKQDLEIENLITKN